jgi:hypothetical protein
MRRAGFIAPSGFPQSTHQKDVNMKRLTIIALAAGAALTAVPAFAQDAAAPAAVEAPAAAPSADMAQAQLAANTPVTLSLNSQVSSKTMRVGDTFPLTVALDVAMDGHIIIPRGTRAVGEVVWRTGRGAFGKSGKIEVAMRYLDLGGRRIPLEGLYRQEGEGNTAATVGAVLAAGVVGGLVISGHSAVIPAGRELTARTLDAIPVAPGADGVTLAIAESYVPSAVQTGRPASANNERRSR